MKKLFKNIKKFYKKYDTTHLFEDNMVTFTKDDMYDYSALMSAYEAIWFTLEDYEDHDACKFLTNLYGELGDYIDTFTCAEPKSNNIITIIKLAISIFGTMSVGAFIAALLEYGADTTIFGGIILGALLAICSGIGVYEDIKVA